MKRIHLVILFFSFFYCGFSQQQNPPSPSISKKDKITYSVFQNADKTFGYDVLKNNKKMIHQPHIPAVPGNAGFKTKKEAEKVATLTIYKIKNGIFPPTIEIKELDSLKIKHN